MSDMPDLGVSEADLDFLDAVPTKVPPADPGDYPPVEPSDFEPPQIVEGLAFADYHADRDSISAGGLRAMARSPRHYWYNHLRPGLVPEEPTDAQRLGTAIHCAVLESAEFGNRFAIKPACDRRTKEGKAIYAEFLETRGDRIELSEAERAAALDVQVAFLTSPFANAKFISKGRAELSVFWTDRETGVRCRMRPDFVPDDKPILLDLKSCTDASDRAFTAAAWRNGYHITAALYVDGWKAATGEKRDYVFAAWEKEPPYASQWFYADDAFLEAGRAAYKRQLQIYAQCRANDDWPGYPAQLIPLFPPAWAVED